MGAAWFIDRPIATRMASEGVGEVLSLRGTGAVLVALTAAGAATLLSLSANEASSAAQWPGPLDVLRQHPWVSSGALTVLGILLASMLQRVRDSAAAGDPPLPAMFVPPEWVVDRGEAQDVVAAVCARSRRTVGITTALEGAGGFGKTTLAELTVANRRVRRRFRGRIFVVTVGREVRSRAAVAAKISEATRFITGDPATFEDPALAGAHLGRLLDQRPRTLLVLDDVWDQDQLDPFLIGGRKCVRLVTTRIPGILPMGSARVRVDAMSHEQARTLVTWGLPALPRVVVEQLLKATGRWPLLLRLTNRLIAAQVETGVDPAAASEAVLRRLHENGPTGIDPELRHALDLDDPKQRNRAVQATVEAATRLLPAGGERRFAELSIFAEDEAVPVVLALQLWKATGGVAEEQGRDMCRQLARLSLLTLSPENGGHLMLHDVLRDYLRRQLASGELTTLNTYLLDAMAVELPPATALDAEVPCAATAWWESPHGYVLDHLVAHLQAAGRTEEADRVVGDLRWVETRLEQRGASAPWSDASVVPTPAARELTEHLAGTAHLLRPTQPAHALVPILHSRIAPLSPRWRAQVAARQETHGSAALQDLWEPPDASVDPALLRALVHTAAVTSLAIAPDGSWLAAGSSDGTVRIWSTTTWSSTALLTGHTGPVHAVAVTGDGTQLASAGEDLAIRVWDLASATCTATLTGHTERVNALAVSPLDGRLASGSSDKSVRIWDLAAEACVDLLHHHVGAVTDVSFSHDGQWLLSSSDIETAAWVAPRSHMAHDWTYQMPFTARFAPNSTWFAGGGSRVYSVDISGNRYSSLYDNPFASEGDTAVHALAFAPDGSWLVGCQADESVRLWETSDRTVRATLTGHNGRINAVAVAPDSSWFATASDDETIRIWNPAANATSSGPAAAMQIAAVAPDGSWVFSRGPDGYSLWDTVTGARRRRYPTNRFTQMDSAMAVAPAGAWAVLTSGRYRPEVHRLLSPGPTGSLPGHSQNVSAVALSSDAVVVASSYIDGVVKIWDVAAEAYKASFVTGAGPVTALAFSPSDTWLAGACGDHTVRLWSTNGGTQLCSFTGHTGLIRSVAVSAGGWIVTGSEDSTVRIWSPERSRRPLVAVLAGHTSAVTAVAVSPDGQHIASVGNDRTLRIWDSMSHECLTLMRTDAVPLTCAWKGAGDQLVVCTRRGVHGYRLLPSE